VGERIDHSLVKALRAVPDFAGLQDGALLDIVGASANLFWPAGSCVFEKGSSTEALYIVLTGRVCIFDVADGEELQVASVGPGGFFGEHSLLLDTEHTKSVRVEEDAEIMVVPRESFQAVLAENPELLAHLMERLEARASST
jgi:CRP/FNR family cyclic AMP-dependent transcriptional regulator